MLDINDAEDRAQIVKCIAEPLKCGISCMLCLMVIASLVFNIISFSYRVYGAFEVESVVELRNTTAEVVNPIPVPLNISVRLTDLISDEYEVVCLKWKRLKGGRKVK